MFSGEHTFFSILMTNDDLFIFIIWASSSFLLEPFALLCFLLALVYCLAVAVYYWLPPQVNGGDDRIALPSFCHLFFDTFFESFTVSPDKRLDKWTCNLVHPTPPCPRPCSPTRHYHLDDRRCVSPNGQCAHLPSSDENKVNFIASGFHIAVLKCWPLISFWLPLLIDDLLRLGPCLSFFVLGVFCCSFWLQLANRPIITLINHHWHQCQLPAWLDLLHF